jgi:hypothetical protein
VVAVLFVCVTLKLLTPMYMENDDVTIADYAMQGFAVRYTGIFFTSLLHLGYAHFPNVAWYGVALYTCHFLSVYLWLSLLFRVFRPWWLGVLLALLFLGFYLVFLVYLDYTSTSVMLCCASLTWAYLDVMERRGGWLYYPLLGLVFTLGMMVRPHGAPGSFIYTLPIGLLAAWVCLREHPPRAELKRLVVVTLLFLAPAALEFAADQVWRVASATPEQAQYDKFNTIRGKLQRISRARKRKIMDSPAILSQVHWTRRDAAFFFNWNFLDERIYTPLTLQTVFDHAPPPAPSADSVLQVLARRMTPYNTVFLLLLGTVPLLLWPGRRRSHIAAALLLPAYEVLLTTCMCTFFAFNYRVELPFEIGFGFSALLVGGWLAARDTSWDGKSYLAAAMACALLAGVSLVTTLRHQYPGYLGQKRIAERTQRTIQTLNRDFAGSVLLLEPKNSLPLERLNPLQVFHFDFHMVQLGWSTFSPRFYRQISYLGIDHGYQLVDALATQDHAYMLGSKGWCASLLPYLTAADPAKTHTREVEVLTPSVSAYRFVVRR